MKKNDQISFATKDFLDATARMRELQRLYFRTRDRATLNEARDAERRVDAYVAAFRSAEKVAKNPELF